MQYIREQIEKLLPNTFEGYDEIFLVVFAILSVILLIMYTQLRGIDPIRFSFVSKKNKYLTPVGRVFLALFTLISWGLILFMLAGFFVVLNE